MSQCPRRRSGTVRGAAPAVAWRCSGCDDRCAVDVVGVWRRRGRCPTLTWYINPDNGGQADLAAKCGDGVRRRLPHRDPDPAQRRRPAARAAGAASRRRRPVRRSDEPRPTVRRRVRQRRLPPADHRSRRRRGVHRRRPRRPAGDRLLGRSARGAAVLGEHPAALVPQVGGRRRRRGSHGRRLHLGRR